MTDPKVRTVYTGGSRWYEDPLTGERVPGVTSIISALNKPALVPWAAKMAATFAVENHTEVDGLLSKPGGKQAAIDLIKGAHRRKTTGAADIGSLAHDQCEQLGRWFLGGKEGDPPEFDPAVVGYLVGFTGFINEYSAAPVLLEETVWSSKHEYAGSFDGIWEVEGKNLLVDVKTGASGVWAEVSLQLSAYRYAGERLDEHGVRRPMPRIDGAAALWLKADGGWALYPVDTTPATFEAFLALRRVFRWQAEASKYAVRPPVNATPAKANRR